MDGWAVDSTYIDLLILHFGSQRWLYFRVALGLGPASEKEQRF